MDKLFNQKTITGIEAINGDELIIDSIQSIDPTLLILNSVEIDGDIATTNCSSLNNLNDDVDIIDLNITSLNETTQNLTTEIEEYPEELKQLTTENIQYLESLDQELSTLSNVEFSNIIAAGSSSRLYSLRIANSGSVNSAFLEVENEHNIPLLHLFNSDYDTQLIIKKSLNNSGIIKFTDDTTDYFIKMNDDNDLSINDEIKINSNGLYLPNIESSNILYVDEDGLLTTTTIEEDLWTLNEDNDIFYTDGKILIGYDTSQDASKLQVDGIIHASSNIVSDGIIGSDSMQVDKTFQAPRIYLKNIETSGVITADIYGDDDNVIINLNKPLLINNEDITIENKIKINTSADIYSDDDNVIIDLNKPLLINNEDVIINSLRLSDNSLITDDTSAGYTHIKPQNNVLILYDNVDGNNNIFRVYYQGSHYLAMYGELDGYTALYSANSSLGIYTSATTYDIQIGANVSGYEDIVYIDTSTKKVGIGGIHPNYTVDIDGIACMNLNPIYKCLGIGFGWSGTYGNNLDYHSIGCDPTDTDSLIINSYDNVYVKLDTNNNNDPSRFVILNYTGNEVFQIYDSGLVNGGYTEWSEFLWGSDESNNVSIFPTSISLSDASATSPTTSIYSTSISICAPYLAESSQSTAGPLIEVSNYRGGGSYNLGFYFHKGSLPGGSYVNSSYPVVKCSYTYMYFAVGGNYVGYIANSSVGSIDFTGQHRAQTDETINKDNIQDYVGLIVVSTGEICSLINAEIKTGIDAITINEAIPVVSLSNREYDKRCFGVVSCGYDNNNDENETIREYKVGCLTSVIHKPVEDKRIYINSVGEGAIWLNNLNGNIENGDYITTSNSNIEGLGMKQNDDILHNYTVAKSTMSCDFELDNPNYECIDCGTYRKAFISCTYHCG